MNRITLAIGLSLTLALSAPVAAQSRKAGGKRKRPAASAKAAKVDPKKLDPLTLPRDKAQALASAAKIKGFYDPKRLDLSPILSAPSACVVDADTGVVLWAKNADKRRAMASTTKIMTALLFIENTQPDDVITCLDPKITRIEESSLHIKPWEKFRARDLLYGFLLRSGNDAGVVIAQHVAGSVPKFAALMNARAREIGTRDTNFVNPHGLTEKYHFTTARELAMIACVAMKNSRFEEAVSQPVRVINRSINQTDTVIKAKVKPYFYDKFPGADGIKTGYTRAAGHCFVGSATRNGRRLISVVLGAPDSASGDTIPLLSWAFARFEAGLVVREGQFVDGPRVGGASAKPLATVAAGSVAVPVDRTTGKPTRDFRQEATFAPVTLPVAKGAAVGTLKVYDGERLVGETELRPRSSARWNRSGGWVRLRVCCWAAVC
jgi:serine-type D-Ala-D-Ala carboxypeptidase (penicillin-binding protein 5/6)